MSSPNASTFDLVPPTRPGTDTFNGIAKEDQVGFVPDPKTQPSAAEWNTIEWLILALGRVMPVVVISITGGATPSVASFSAAPKSLVTGSFTVVRNGAGDVSITWPVDTFPSSVVKPEAMLNAGPGMIHAVSITNGVRVFTYNSGGAATDFDFTVSVY